MLEHIIRFERGYDCRTFECINDSERCYPGSRGFHGATGLNIRFLVKGPDGAVQFLLNTGWLPQQTKENEIGHRDIEEWGKALGEFYPSPVDLGFHAKKPQYDGQEVIHESCEFCDDAPCYYDGSGLNAYDAMYTLVNGGDEALWRFLEEYYQCIFHKGAYPSPAEYSKKRRLEDYSA